MMKIEKLSVDKNSYYCGNSLNLIEDKINEIIDHLNTEQPSQECPDKKLVYDGKWKTEDLGKPQAEEKKFDIKSMDAKVWAKEFMKHANAIMAGYDEAQRREVI